VDRLGERPDLVGVPVLDGLRAEVDVGFGDLRAGEFELLAAFGHHRVHERVCERLLTRPPFDLVGPDLVGAARPGDGCPRRGRRSVQPDAADDRRREDVDVVCGGHRVVAARRTRRLHARYHRHRSAGSLDRLVHPFGRRRCAAGRVEFQHHRADGVVGAYLGELRLNVVGEPGGNRPLDLDDGDGVAGVAGGAVDARCDDDPEEGGGHHDGRELSPWRHCCRALVGCHSRIDPAASRV
jgi:hypothetical protein